MTAKDSKHAEKASRGKEGAMVEMWNAKNVYLLSIEVSNRMLHKYFDKDLPAIHDVSVAIIQQRLCLLGQIIACRICKPYGQPLWRASRI